MSTDAQHWCTEIIWASISRGHFIPSMRSLQTCIIRVMDMGQIEEREWGVGSGECNGCVARGERGRELDA